jgi:uncharacterized protein YkwD
MRGRTIALAAAVLAGVAASPAAAQYVPSGPDWYRSKDLQLDQRIVLAQAVPSSPGMYAAKDPLLGLCVAEASWGTPDPREVSNFVAAFNAQRAQSGLPPLNPDRNLAAAAMWKSMHMARYDYLDHDDPAPPEARSVFQRGIECGYGNYIGENLAEGQDNARETIEEWLGSPVHRHVMENPAYQDMGVGVATARNGDKYWTLDVGRKQ